MQSRCRAICHIIARKWLLLTPPPEREASIDVVAKVSHCHVSQCAAVDLAANIAAH